MLPEGRNCASGRYRMGETRERLDRADREGVRGSTRSPQAMRQNLSTDHIHTESRATYILYVCPALHVYVSPSCAISNIPARLALDACHDFIGLSACRIEERTPQSSSESHVRALRNSKR